MRSYVQGTNPQVPRGPVCNAPSLCLAVTPAQGWDNGLTSYTASLASWATDFPPLSYEIGYVDDDGLEIALVSNSQLPSYTFATLPAGLAAKNNTRTVYACVSDAWLSQVRATYRISFAERDFVWASRSSKYRVINIHIANGPRGEVSVQVLVKGRSHTSHPFLHELSASRFSSCHAA